MANIDFRVKPIASLTASDFENAPLWAGYYEPDDVEDIVRWGIPESIVRAALDEVGWQDDHYFPLPLEASKSEWMRGKFFGVKAITANGIELDGYVGESYDLISILADGQQFVLSDSTPDERRRLESVIGTFAFPLRVFNRVTGEHWNYPPE